MPPPKEITPEEWTRIVSVFAEYEGRVVPAARALGWPYAKAQRRWKYGYPSLGYPPIKKILACDEFSADEVRAARSKIESDLPKSADLRNPMDDPHRAVVISTAEAARVRAMVKREEERAASRADAVKARGEEATLIQINRRNAIAMNVMTTRLLQGATKMAEQIQLQLEEEARSPTMPVGERLKLVKSAASIARFNAEATVMAVKAERLVAGDPIDAEASGAAIAESSLNEAAAWIEQCQRALERARSRGLITAPAVAESKNG